jgi:hypothetical protein
VQLASAGTDVHEVWQWSSKHAPHDASHSVELVDASEDAEQLAMQLALRSAVHWVVQSSVGVHVVLQLVSQLDVQLASALSVQVDSHCCSSLAAQVATKLSVVHLSVQAVSVSTSQLALALTSKLPQAETMSAWARRGANVSVAKVRVRIVACRVREGSWFMVLELSNDRTTYDARQSPLESETLCLNHAMRETQMRRHERKSIVPFRGRPLARLQSATIQRRALHKGPVYLACRVVHICSSSRSLSILTTAGAYIGSKPLSPPAWALRQGLSDAAPP